ncbi:hypothetical protein NE865_01981 [Phthorimaea operculella]|nr:hypothetical protein NE865_01981 [Phthorimaea operculella]
MAEDEAAAKARQARLQELRASRRYLKCSITRLNTFAENKADVDESSLLTLRSKRERLTELFKKYEDCQMQVLGLDESDNDDVSEVEDTYTSRAYQLERSDESDPTVVDFLQYLEKRALALENAEPVSSNKSQKTSVVNVAVTPPASGAKPCAVSGAAGCSSAGGSDTK